MLNRSVIRDDSGLSLKYLIDSKLKDMYTCIPGSIQEINFNKQTATVKIDLAFFNGQEVYIPETIENVPIIFPSGGGFSLTFPVNNETPCLILFSQLDLDNWLNEGVDRPTNTPRHHDINDAICIPGLYSPLSPISGISETNAELRNSDNTVNISLGRDITLDNKNKNSKIDISDGISFESNTVELVDLITEITEILTLVDSSLGAPNASRLAKVFTKLELFKGI